MYKPMAAKELNRKSIVVFYGNPVGKHEFIEHRIGIIRLVELLYNDIDAFGYLRLHFADLFKYKNYPQSKNTEHNFCNLIAYYFNLIHC
jgi:hypothetical protein